MATISLYTYSVANGNRKIRYAISKQLPGDPLSSEICPTEAEAVIQFFAASRSVQPAPCPKPVAEMIHSFSPEESKRLDPEVINQIGHKVATTMFPGHQLVVVTHLDRGHYHNHIIMDRHHFETGKLTRDSFQILKKLRETNDRICSEYGLSTLSEERKEREARMPKEVAQMIRHGRASYVADTMQKADFARSIATSYDQYQGIMAEFGITVRLEQKNISYLYPGRNHPKRGKNMGALYDKPGLQKAFKDNDERFQKIPALREILTSHLRQAKATPNAMKDLTEKLAAKTDGHFQSGVKDYSKHEIVPRREARWARASEEELARSLVPIDEFRKARRINIVDYCKQNGIKLEAKSSGTHTLAGRPYVEVSDYEWRNNKNNTRGNLIDLVAAHKQISFLEALAEINGNKRLLLLQQEIGETKRTYTSFYVPKDKSELSLSHLQNLGQALGRSNTKDEHASILMKSGQAQVSKDGVIRLFAKDDPYGALQYEQNEHGDWKAQKLGQFSRPFFSLSGNGRKVNVFLDPFSFIRSRPKELFPTRKESDGILALMEPDARLVDQFLSGHRHVDTLRLVAADPAKPSPEFLDFFNLVRERYRQHGVSVEAVSIEKTLPGRGIGLER